MHIYCSILLSLNVMTLLLSKKEERFSLLLAQLITLPIYGRVMQWW